MITASGGMPERLAVSGENAVGISVSRTRNRLIYARGTGDFNIWRIPGPTSLDRKTSPTRFITSTQDDLEPQFSPDGRKIAFTSGRSGANEIWVCDRDGLNPVQLTSFKAETLVGSPRWSPDSFTLE
jgi:Tol biopolymer transport system component